MFSVLEMDYRSDTVRTTPWLTGFLVELQDVPVEVQQAAIRALTVTFKESTTKMLHSSNCSHASNSASQVELPVMTVPGRRACKHCLSSVRVTAPASVWLLSLLKFSSEIDDSEAWTDQYSAARFVEWMLSSSASIPQQWSDIEPFLTEKLDRLRQLSVLPVVKSAVPVYVTGARLTSQNLSKALSSIQETYHILPSRLLRYQPYYEEGEARDLLISRLDEMFGASERLEERVSVSDAMRLFAEAGDETVDVFSWQERLRELGRRDCEEKVDEALEGLRHPKPVVCLPTGTRQIYNENHVARAISVSRAPRGELPGSHVYVVPASSRLGSFLELTESVTFADVDEFVDSQLADSD